MRHGQRLLHGHVALLCRGKLCCRLHLSPLEGTEGRLDLGAPPPLLLQLLLECPRVLLLPGGLPLQPLHGGVGHAELVLQLVTGRLDRLELPTELQSRRLGLEQVGAQLVPSLLRLCQAGIQLGTDPLQQLGPGGRLCQPGLDRAGTAL